jgi:hypothetical protein
MAASNATKEAIWLHVLLKDLGFTQVQATTIHGDNQECIALLYGIAHLCAKHINIRHHSISQHITNAEVDLRYCPTKNMLADIFIKQLPHKAFKKFRKELGVSEYQKILLSGSDDK